MDLQPAGQRIMPPDDISAMKMAMKERQISITEDEITTSFLPVSDKSVVSPDKAVVIHEAGELDFPELTDIYKTIQQNQHPLISSNEKHGDVLMEKETGEAHEQDEDDMYCEDREDLIALRKGADLAGDQPGQHPQDGVITEQITADITHRDAVEAETTEMTRHDVVEPGTKEMNHRNAVETETPETTRHAAVETGTTEMNHGNAVETETPEMTRHAAVEAETTEMDHRNAVETETPETTRHGVVEAETTEMNHRNAVETESPEMTRHAAVEAETTEMDHRNGVETEIPEMTRHAAVEAETTEMDHRNAVETETTETTHHDAVVTVESSSVYQPEHRMRVEPEAHEHGLEESEDVIAPDKGDDSVEHDQDISAENPPEEEVTALPELTLPPEEDELNAAFLSLPTEEDGDKVTESSSLENSLPENIAEWDKDRIMQELLIDLRDPNPDLGRGRRGQLLTYSLEKDKEFLSIIVRYLEYREQACKQGSPDNLTSPPVVDYFSTPSIPDESYLESATNFDLLSWLTPTPVYSQVRYGRTKQLQRLSHIEDGDNDGMSGVILNTQRGNFGITNKYRYNKDTEFKVLSQLGEGSFGVVCKAEDIKTKFSFAIKQISKSKFERNELLILSAVQHQSIVSLYGCLADNKHVYMLTECIHGLNIKKWIQQEGQMNLYVALTIYRKMLAVVDYLEKHHIFHEDLKVQNWVRVRDTYGAKLVDFGMAHQVHESCKQTRGSSRHRGAPSHWSPEKAAEKPYDHRSETWAVNINLYQLLQGERPWEHIHRQEDLRQEIIFGDVPTPPPNLPEAVHEMMVLGFEKDQMKRRTAQELMEHRAFSLLKAEYFPSDAVFIKHIRPENLSTRDKSQLTAGDYSETRRSRDMPLSDISGPRDISFLLTACVEGSPSDSPPAADEADSDVLENVSSDYTEASDSYSESDNSFEESVEDSGASVTLSDLMSRENEAEPPPNGIDLEFVDLFGTILMTWHIMCFFNITWRNLMEEGGAETIAKGGFDKYYLKVGDRPLPLGECDVIATTWQQTRPNKLILSISVIELTDEDEAPPWFIQNKRIEQPQQVTENNEGEVSDGDRGSGQREARIDNDARHISDHEMANGRNN